MKLKLHFSQKPEINLFFLTFYYVYFIGFFIFQFNLPSSALYLSDVFNILIIILCVGKYHKIFQFKEIKIVNSLLLILLFEGTFSAICHGFNLNLWIWSIRNWGRLFTFFYSGICILQKKHIDKIISFTEILFHVNCIAIIIQYLLSNGNFTPDQLNGLVGRDTSGANLLLMLIGITIISSKYFCGQYKISKVVFSLIELGIISIISELKAVLPFALIIILIIAALNSNLTSKKIVKNVFVIVLAIFIIYIALRIMSKVYPQFADYLTINSMIAGATTSGGYGNNGYIDRLTSFSVINRFFFKDNTVLQMFGIGMGNAEYSSFAPFTSDFFNLFGKEVIYLRFSVACLYLEVGLVGFLLYLFIMIVLFMFPAVSSRKYFKQKLSIQARIYQNIGVGIGIINIIYIWYTNLQRTDMSFLLAAYMVIPIVAKKIGNNDYDT